MLLLFVQVNFLLYYLKFKSTDIQIDKPAASDYNDLCNQEFHVHAEYIKEENDDNSVKAEQAERRLSPCYETSDETDSDIDSIKCVYCSQSYSNYGAHTCHVTCTIEHNQLQKSSSNETLVAADVTQTKTPKSMSPVTSIQEYANVSCVLCDKKYDRYEDYVNHLNICTNNVKLHHFVCPVCHEMFSDKFAYLEHLKVFHFKADDMLSDEGTDCVDFAPMIVKTRKPKAVRRQIGWSIEDIYQEIECQKVEQKPTPTSSPIKNFFSKLGNE